MATNPPLPKESDLQKMVDSLMPTSYRTYRAPPFDATAAGNGFSAVIFSSTASALLSHNESRSSWNVIIACSTMAIAWNVSPALRHELGEVEPDPRGADPVEVLLAQPDRAPQQPPGLGEHPHPAVDQAQRVQRVALADGVAGTLHHAEHRRDQLLRLLVPALHEHRAAEPVQHLGLDARAGDLPAHAERAAQLTDRELVLTAVE